ncbi:MAG: transglutaminase family protein [Geminicoccaceae bacterium]
MRIRIGFDIIHVCPQPTPMVLTLSVHHSRVSDLEHPDLLITEPAVPLKAYRDGFGNWCTRIVAPQGEIRLRADTVVRDSGQPDIVAPDTPQNEVHDLPEETLVFLLGSRYCDTDHLLDPAWERFGKTEPGWARVQAICDFVHQHVTFGYAHARATRTAFETFKEQRGVCRDFAHLAVALCRCMNIPARYCTGYLGDIGVPPDPDPMDFSGWFEAYLGNRWYTFDARHNTPRIGRVLLARGRDAADVAISTSYGRNQLKQFKIWTEELTEKPKEAAPGLRQAEGR